MKDDRSDQPASAGSVAAFEDCTDFSPSCNTGGKVPAAQQTFIDWLAFRTRQPPMEIVASLSPAFSDGELLHLSTRQKSNFRAFESKYFVSKRLAVVAEIHCGGPQQRGWSFVQIGGAQCRAILDYAPICSIHQAGAELRRLDVALDADPDVVSHDIVVAAYPQAFTGRGRPPKIETIESFNGVRNGRSVLIGTRGSDKALRAYERHTPGRPTRPMTTYRVEVEFRAESRPLPWDMISRRDEYFVGSYKFCQGLLPHPVRPAAPPTQRAHALELLDEKLAHARRSYGATIATALATGMTNDQVIERLLGGHLDVPLVRAGVLA